MRARTTVGRRCCTMTTRTRWGRSCSGPAPTWMVRGHREDAQTAPVHAEGVDAAVTEERQRHRAGGRGRQGGPAEAGTTRHFQLTVGARLAAGVPIARRSARQRWPASVGWRPTESGGDPTSPAGRRARGRADRSGRPRRRPRVRCWWTPMRRAGGRGCCSRPRPARVGPISRHRCRPGRTPRPDPRRLHPVPTMGVADGPKATASRPSTSHPRRQDRSGSRFPRAEPNGATTRCWPEPDRRRDVSAPGRSGAAGHGHRIGSGDQGGGHQGRGPARALVVAPGQRRDSAAADSVRNPR